jgi:transcriptional regulator with XRE-family HTH domain
MHAHGECILIPVEDDVQDGLHQPEPEVLAGHQLRQLRLAHGWSQQEVANRMNAFGFNWQQSTVGKTETAQRPLRVNELTALAAVFDVGIGNVLMPGGIPRDYPHHMAIPDDELPLEAIEEEIALLRRESEKGDDWLHGLRGALDSAARTHRIAQMEYDSAVTRIEAARSRLVFLLGRREELLATRGGSVD